jgi:prophage antirepressor-like protein
MSKKMMSVFEFKKHQIRTVTDQDGHIWWVGVDAAKALGYKDPGKAVRQHCKGRVKRPIPTAGGIQQMECINEPNLYRLIAHSKLPSAERFERWIFETVIPSIRKHGGYISEKATIEQVEVLVREWNRERRQLITTIKEQHNRISLLENQLRTTIQGLEMIKPQKPFGEESKTTGLPKDVLVISHFRSDRRCSRKISDAVQLLLPLFQALSEEVEA